MDRQSVVYALHCAAFIAQQGCGGVMEAEALVVVVASRDAYEKGGVFRKLRAARLVGAWRKKYANNGF